MNQLNLFIELTRLKKPIGFMLLFWPCIWGLTIVHNFNSNLFNGLSLYNYTDKKQNISNNAEILRCSYKPGFNYGTFRISMDRLVSKMNQLKIQYGIEYFQEESNSRKFIWINYFYEEDFKNNISTQWLSDPDSTEIKNEFLDNAECIDSKIYRFFQI